MAKKEQQRQTFSEMLQVSNKSAAWVLKNLPFVLFLGFLAMIYIANNHYAQRSVREIREKQEDLKELRRVFNALNAEVVHESKREEIAESVSGMGLKPSKLAPSKIIIQKGRYKEPTIEKIAD